MFERILPCFVWIHRYLLKLFIHPTLAAGKMIFPDQKLHPSSVKYRRISAWGAQRLEMLLSIVSYADCLCFIRAIILITVSTIWLNLYALLCRFNCPFVFGISKLLSRIKYPCPGNALIYGPPISAHPYLRLNEICYIMMQIYIKEILTSDERSEVRCQVGLGRINGSCTHFNWSLNWNLLLVRE
jgi:hypothetical protein